MAVSGAAHRNHRLQVDAADFDVLRILQLLSWGLSTRQVLRQSPGLSERDIRHALRLAHDYIAARSALDIRPLVGALPPKTAAAHAGPVMPSSWTRDDEIEMRRLLFHGATVAHISRLFVRPEEEICRRLAAILSGS